MKRLINRFKTFDIKRMIKMINVIKKRSGHSFLWIILDIFRCAIKFGSGYMDYYLFYFEELTDVEKSTYINISVNTKYIRDCNDPSYYYVLNDKTVFLKKYKDFIKRDTLDIRESTYEEYESFVDKHNEFMAKPVDGFCGYGIELINKENKDIKELYNSFKEKGQYLLEERIKQCEELNSIYPHAINTIRVVTLNRNNDIKIMFTCIRIGNNGKIVDNFNNGGMIAPIDENGTISKVGLDKNNVVYEKHPMTNTQIVGFKIPRYDEIIELCKNLAKVTPEIGLSGWDIAISEDGLDVVEGNQIPGYDIYQSKEHIAPSRCGIKEKFDNAIYPEKKDKKIFARGYCFTKLIWLLFFSLSIDLLLAYFGLSTNLFIYSLISYLFLYKKIDRRPLWKTIVFSIVIGIAVSIIDYLFSLYTFYIYQNYVSPEEFAGISPFYIFEDFLGEAILEIVWIIIKSILAIIFLNYFGIPLLDKFIESINPKVGIVLTIFVSLLVIIFIALIISPILYTLFYLKYE